MFHMKQSKTKQVIASIKKRICIYNMYTENSVPALRAAAHDYCGCYICAFKTNTVQNTPTNKSIKLIHTKS